MRRVFELMTREVVVLHEEDTLTHAEHLFARRGIRHLPVVRDRKLVGLLTETDLLRYCRHGDERRPPIHVGQAMTRQVVTARPQHSLLEAIRQMLESKLGCLPVTREDGTLVGIVTQTDLLRVAASRVEEADRQELAREHGA